MYIYKIYMYIHICTHIYTYTDIAIIITPDKVYVLRKFYIANTLLPLLRSRGILNPFFFLINRMFNADLVRDVKLGIFLLIHSLLSLTYAPTKD